MNHRLKHSAEATSRTLCKYTASPATSQIYIELIYLLPMKETTIIIFTLQAAASGISLSSPPIATAKDSVTDTALLWSSPPTHSVATERTTPLDM